MAGSPKKRARREAAARAALDTAQRETALPSATDAGVPAASLPAPIPVVQGEIVEPTRTALKRAMRAKAQEYAEKALVVLNAALSSADERVRVAAANDLLAWGFGKPAQEVEAGEGVAQIVIMKFRENA